MSSGEGATRKRCTAVSGVSPPPMRKSRTSRWRAGVLIAVHVAILGHLLQWYLVRDAGGRTLSPVEPSEAMYTLERGELNAGFLFLCLAVLSTAVFGRFFCGWGCHIVALQDLCGWLMKKAGVRPQPFRSRLLAWVPLILALYMFVWPSFKRLVLFPLLGALWPQAAAAFAPVPAWHGFSNHLLVVDFWDTFAGVAVAVPFFLIVGFAAVYFLGAKGFCTYGCPYGGIFGVVDRIAPGRIVADLEACEGCGHCTATCTSNVRVHEEIQVYGRVADSGCMKCMDCVSVCPNGALSFAFRVPARGRSRLLKPVPPREYDLSAKEEGALGAIFLGVFLAYRGLYETIPMLMAVGIAGVLTFLAWKALRLLRDANLRFHGFRLRADGRLQPAGKALAGVTVLLFILTLHSGLVRFHYWRGMELDARVTVPREPVLAGISPFSIPLEQRETASRALQRFHMASPLAEGGLGLLSTPGLGTRMAWLNLVLGDRAAAERLLVREWEAAGPADALGADLARVMALRGRPGEAAAFLEEVLAGHPGFDQVRDRLADLLLEAGRTDEAARLYLERLEREPDNALLRGRLGSAVYLTAERFEDAVRELRRAAEDAPGSGPLRHELAVALWKQGDRQAALREMEAAARLDPSSQATLDEMRRQAAAGD